MSLIAIHLRINCDLASRISVFRIKVDSHFLGLIGIIGSEGGIKIIFRVYLSTTKLGFPDMQLSTHQHIQEENKLHRKKHTRSGLTQSMCVGIPNFEYCPNEMIREQVDMTLWFGITRAWWLCWRCRIRELWVHGHCRLTMWSHKTGSLLW